MKIPWLQRLAFRHWPVAWKLTVSILVIFLVVQLLITAVGDYLVRDSLLRGQEQELFERAVQQASLLRTWRDGLLQGLIDAATQDGARLQSQAEAPPLLAQYRLRWSDFRDLSVLDGQGRVVSSTDGALQGKDWSRAAWFADARRPMAGISHLQKEDGAEAPVFVFYAPLHSSDYTLAARLPATALWARVDPVRVRKSGYIFMSDENAVTIAHGVKEASGQFLHKFVLYAIGAPDNQALQRANAQQLYGERPITRTVGLHSLADFILALPEELSNDPVFHTHRYYWDVQKTWKTVMVVPVGAPVGLSGPTSVQAKSWVLAITVGDNDFLAPLVSLQRGLLAVTAIGVALVVGCAALFGRAFSRPLRRLADLARNVQSGAYEERSGLTQQDEIGQLGRGIDAMLDRLVALMSAQQQQLQTLLRTAEAVERDAGTVSTSAEELAAATEELNASAEEVAHTVQSMAQDAYEQMNQVQRTAGEIQGLDGEIGQVSALSQSVERSSEHLRRLAEEAGRAVAQACERSQRIETVVRMIEKFSRQTNMLALNATIEAARAGEMGESFAVVADEVRRLAEGSRQALNEVAALNEAIRQSMGTIRGTVEQTRAAVAEVVALAGQMAQTAGRQAEASRSLVGVVNQLAAIAEKNAAGAEELAAAVEEQTNAFGEISVSSQQLAGLAQHMRALACELAAGQSEPEGSSHGRF